MEERRYDGSVKFTELSKADDAQKKLSDAIDNPENKTVVIHKDGSRTVFGGMVYEFKNGKMEKVGLSFQNTTETIQEHESER